MLIPFSTLTTSLPQPSLPQPLLAIQVVRYQELFAEKEAMNRKWDEENQILIEAHADYLRQITEEYDRKVTLTLTLALTPKPQNPKTPNPLIIKSSKVS